MPNHRNTNAPAGLKTAEAWQRVLLQSVVLKRLNAIHRDYKAAVVEGLQPGDKKAIKNEQGVTYGTISVTAPGKKAVCTDPAVLLALADERGEEIIDALPAPGSEKAQAAIDFLFEHAPHLLDSGVSPEVEKQLAEEVLETWQIDGTVPAGWEIRDASRPTTRITAGRSTAAKAIIDRMLTSAADVLELEEGSK